MLEVAQIKSSVGKALIRENHYSHSCHNGPVCIGLLENGSIIGVCAFATPCSEAVRSWPFGSEHKSRVTELHRLWVSDEHTGPTSWFVSRALGVLRLGRPHIRAVVSFADQTEGHSGTIYRALSFMYYGETGRATFYRDAEGRLRHPRQCGVNITKPAAQEMGWTPETRAAKHRFIRVWGKHWRKLLIERRGHPHP